MTIQSVHFGLFFHSQHVAAAQAGKADAPLNAAWEHLAAPPPDEPLFAALWLAYRYRFSGDTAAAEQAGIQFLQSSVGEETPLEALRRLVVSAQVLELLRDSPAFDPQWLAGLEENAQWLLSQNELPPDAEFWAVTVRITAGIVLDNEALFNSGVADFRAIIDRQEIHAEGFLRTVATSKGSHTLERQLDLVCALSLAAEAASLAGVNLWQHESRGVSVVTAAAYLVYYYFYPEKWRWSDTGAYTTEMTKALYKDQGAFLEIVASHVPEKALRGVNFLFEAQRPMVSRYGGMTTLSHAKPKKRRGWFR